MEIYLDDISRIGPNKAILEKKLNVKITFKGNEILFEGEAVDEYIAEKVLMALNFGFSLKTSLLLKNEENYNFEILNIKDFTKRKDLERIRGRIIGTNGRTLRTLTELTKCFFELKDNSVGIIGDSGHIKNAQTSLISLIHGTKQANVYSFLEKHQPKEIVDFSLKEDKRKKRKTKTFK